MVLLEEARGVTDGKGEGKGIRAHACGAAVESQETRHKAKGSACLHQALGVAVVAVSEGEVGSGVEEEAEEDSREDAKRDQVAIKSVFSLAVR